MFLLYYSVNELHLLEIEELVPKSDTGLQAVVKFETINWGLSNQPWK